MSYDRSGVHATEFLIPYTIRPESIKEMDDEIHI